MDRKLLIARYVAFALLISPVCGWLSAIIIATCANRDFNLGLMHGEVVGIPVGLVSGVLSGYLPAKGNMTLFVIVVLLITNLVMCPLALLIGLAVVPFFPIVYIIGILVYFQMNKSMTRSEA